MIPAKIIIARPGPGTGTLTAGSWGYFPSGHTSTACVCYSIAVLLLVAGRAARVRRAALAGLAVLWLLVGVALVWSDYHWASDVLAGWALSGLIVWLALRVRLPGWPRWAARRSAQLHDLTAGQAAADAYESLTRAGRVWAAASACS